MCYVFTDYVSSKAYWIVLESLGVFKSCTVVTEAVEIPLRQDDDTDLEAAQRDGLDTEDSLPEVVRPIWLQSSRTFHIPYDVGSAAGFCYVLISVIDQGSRLQIEKYSRNHSNLFPKLFPLHFFKSTNIHQEKMFDSR